MTACLQEAEVVGSLIIPSLGGGGDTRTCCEISSSNSRYVKGSCEEDGKKTGRRRASFCMRMVIYFIFNGGSTLVIQTFQHTNGYTTACPTVQQMARQQQDEQLGSLEGVIGNLNYAAEGIKTELDEQAMYVGCGMGAAMGGLRNRIYINAAWRAHAGQLLSLPPLRLNVCIHNVILDVYIGYNVDTNCVQGLVPNGS